MFIQPTYTVWERWRVGTGKLLCSHTLFISFTLFYRFSTNTVHQKLKLITNCNQYRWNEVCVFHLFFFFSYFPLLFRSFGGSYYRSIQNSMWLYAFVWNASAIREIMHRHTTSRYIWNDNMRGKKRVVLIRIGWYVLCRKMRVLVCGNNFHMVGLVLVLNISFDHFTFGLNACVLDTDSQHAHSHAFQATHVLVCLSM